MNAIDTANWDKIYRDPSHFGGPPPWNIGQPQPELMPLLDAGVDDPVLDAGCGVAELSLLLASRGHTVTGLDISPTAIHTAQQAAIQRQLTHVQFAQADISDITTYPSYCHNYFNTIIDSTLLHSLPAHRREGYLQSIYQASASKAHYYALVFATGAFPRHLRDNESDASQQFLPYEFDHDQLYQLVNAYWNVDTIRPSWIYAYGAPELMTAFPERFQEAPTIMTSSSQPLYPFPALLLEAHRD